MREQYRGSVFASLEEMAAVFGNPQEVSELVDQFKITKRWTVNGDIEIHDFLVQDRSPSNSRWHITSPNIKAFDIIVKSLKKIYGDEMPFRLVKICA